jgi:hypothetical protein
MKTIDPREKFGKKYVCGSLGLVSGLFSAGYLIGFALNLVTGTPMEHPFRILAIGLACGFFTFLMLLASED